VRTTGQLFRWGLTCLLLAPLSFMAAWALAAPAPFLWAALALIVLGGALNAAAIVRGVRGVRGVQSGGVQSGGGRSRGGRPPLDGMSSSSWANSQGPTTQGGWAGSAEDELPRQRILFPDDGPASPPTRPSRRRVGLSAAAALLGFIAFGAYTLAIEQPLVIAQGQLTLDEVYGLWGTASRAGFTISLTIWVLLSLAVVIGVAALALFASPLADRLLITRRMLAAACIAGSVIVVASTFPSFSMGISLPDEMPFSAGGTLGPGGYLFTLSGFGLSAAAILLTVPSWSRRPR